MMGKLHSSKKKKKSIENLVGNAENEHPVPHHNKA
jgi:hypothetical protein